MDITKITEKAIDFAEQNKIVVGCASAGALAGISLVYLWKLMKKSKKHQKPLNRSVKRHNGSCVCGKVNFTATTSNPCVCIDCDCTACTKFGLNKQFFVTEKNFELNTGSYNIQTYDGRTFCQCCGSHIFKVQGQHILVNAGLIDTKLDYVLTLGNVHTYVPKGLSEDNEDMTLEDELASFEATTNAHEMPIPRPESNSFVPQSPVRQPMHTPRASDDEKAAFNEKELEKARLFLRKHTEHE